VDLKEEEEPVTSEEADEMKKVEAVEDQEEETEETEEAEEVQASLLEGEEEAESP
jgi:hypothetical protein